MITQNPYRDYYHVGGSLKYQHPSYVERNADYQLQEELRKGEFCYVLNARQMGKSSLRVKTMQTLASTNIKCASVDLTGIGRHINQENWYFSFFYKLLSEFYGSDNFNNYQVWWQQHKILSPVQRLGQFIENVLLIEFEQQLVIFIDEIESIIEFDFKDDFFAWIRACYNQRADNPIYERLTFCLFGGTTPSRLIGDKEITAFNVGQAIELPGFTLAEAEPRLIPGLEKCIDSPREVLEEILDWTGGQPFLTQKLCRIVAQRASSRNPNVSQLVQTYIIENWEFQDEPMHLRSIRDRILHDEQRASRLLGLYQHILQQKEISADGSSEQVELRLSGLVLEEKGKLRVYNKICEAIFNQDWVARELGKLRPYSEAITAWIESHYQDESRLLRGQALRDAQVWAVNKSLSDLDYRFLNASQEDERRAIELERLEAQVNWETEKRKSEAEREINQRLAEANRELQKIYKKANRRIRLGTFTLVLSWLIAMIIAVTAYQNINKLREVQLGTLQERTGIQILQNFETAELQNFLQLMHVGQGLYNLVKDGRSLKEYPAASPIVALQMGLREIQQRNQLDLPEGILSVGYSPKYNLDQQYLATGGGNGTIRLWSVSGKSIATTWNSNQGQVLGISFDPKQQRLATVGGDGTIRFWTLSGKQLLVWQAHYGAARSVSFSLDGQQLATGGQDGKVRIWNSLGKKLAEWQAHPAGEKFPWSEKTVPGGVMEGVSVSFDPKGKQLATTGPDYIVRFWDLSGKQQSEFRIEREILGIKFSPDGQSLATAEGDAEAVIRDLTGQKRHQYISSKRGVVWDVDFSPDGQRLVAVGIDGIARVWDLSEKVSGEELTIDAYDEARVWQIRFSPDGHHIATLRDDDGTFRIRDLSLPNTIVLEKKNVSSFDLHGQFLILGTQQGIVQIWNLSNQELLSEWTAHQNLVSSVRFSSDGNRVLTGGRDLKIRLWNLLEKEQPKKLSEWSRGFIAIMSPDDQHIAALGDDGILRLWHTSGRMLFEKNLYMFSIRGLDFSSDGELLAISVNDYTAPVRILNLMGEEQATVIIPGQNRVEQVSFSPDGQLLATSGIDATVRLWTLSGQQISQFDVYPAGSGPWVRSIAFSPNGKLIATAVDPTGEIKIWRIEMLDDLLKRGCDWLEEYFVNHPQDLESLGVCQGLSINRIKN